MGPIDDYDIGNLINTFNAAHKLKKPVLVHVVTTKAKDILMQKLIKLATMRSLHLI